MMFNSGDIEIEIARQRTPHICKNCNFYTCRWSGRTMKCTCFPEHREIENPSEWTCGQFRLSKNIEMAAFFSAFGPISRRA
jgi:hypothetical protein